MLILMRQHGRTIVFCILSFLVLGALGSVRSGTEEGFIEIAYRKAFGDSVKTDVASYVDAEAVKAQAARKKPVITFTYVKTLPKKEVNIYQMFSAKDADGNAVMVEITDILKRDGKSVLYRNELEKKKKMPLYDTKKFPFPTVGVYSILVKAVDREKRTSYGQYKLPVTSK